MFQILPERIAGLRRFFSAAEPPPNAPMLEAFLEGRAPGRAFVDDFRAARSCVVAMNYSFVFFGGDVTGGFVAGAVRKLRRHGPLHLVWPEDDARYPAAPRADQLVPRLEFRTRANPHDPARRDRLPQAGGDLAVRRIDGALFRRCQWRGEVVRAVGSEREFLAHGIGFCLAAGDAIVSEAYAAFWGGDRTEIAVITHPDHRGRGYASAVCAHLIAACEGVGLQPYWSCDAANAASLRVAAKLGFSDPRPYRLLRYEQDPPPRIT